MQTMVLKIEDEDEVEEAYQNGLEELKNGKAIDFDTYLTNRGIA